MISGQQTGSSARYLATTRTGQSYVVTVLAENPSRPIDQVAAIHGHALGDPGGVHAGGARLISGYH